ncbi:PLP-dependent aminotransferase family protein [Archangium violaceum]|uniref:aminotransferase-like domain-containing protein n=1 Tax=Archangium violaceum TaxID=83451 RepID=UPI00194EBA4B|nr:PLP-dependent aminotransferase family protein [Archangium violaceum]QRN94789.1 PLP-dependent aminotransferase family protein [Archangium violaceum]
MSGGTELPLAGWAKELQPSAIQDALQRILRPGVLSLALGLPAEELFPAQGLAEAAARVLAEQPLAALQYGAALQPLRQKVVELMALRGVRCSPEQVFLTAGSQQAMSLLARLFLEPGSTVLLEERVYSGFQQVLEPFQPRRLTVGTDLSTGIDVDAVEAVLRRGERPSLLYVMSDGHNPLGVRMSAEKRERLVKVARDYRLPIIEDDAYGLLQYEPDPLPPLRALESQWVFYLGSFSKILAPSLRVGWLVVPEELIHRLATVKEASDIDTTSFAQRVVLAFLESGRLDAHLARLRDEYRRRRDALLGALETHFPSGAKWTRPSSGMFVWVELPGNVDTTALLMRAVEQEQVAFLPGQAFAVPGGPSAAHCLRLNFSHCEPDVLRDAVARLARVLRKG